MKLNPDQLSVGLRKPVACNMKSHIRISYLSDAVKPLEMVDTEPGAHIGSQVNSVVKPWHQKLL